MPPYPVNQEVIWSGDGKTYVVRTVHYNTQPPTYDIRLVSDSKVTHNNVPEGDLHVAD